MPVPKQPSRRPPSKRPTVRPSGFPEAEAVTLPQRIEHRAASLLRAWHLLTEHDKRRVESVVELMAYAREK